MFLRHTFPTAPGDINLATTHNPSWQLPSNILHQLHNRTLQHPIQQAMTPWGLFTRMDLRDATNRHTHYEQSLTVPFATNTSSPELAIIRWLMHQRITHERQRVTHDYFTDLQRNRNLQPGSYYNAVARDWITTAADIYRATRGQTLTSTHNFPKHGADHSRFDQRHNTARRALHGDRQQHHHRWQHWPTHLCRTMNHRTRSSSERRQT